MIKMGTTG